MAKKHAHRPSTPGYVELHTDAAKVPPTVLTGPDLSPVRNLHAAYMEAQADVEAHHDELDSALAAPAERDAAIRAAVQMGKRVPPAISEVEAQAKVKVATDALAASLNRAKAAGDAYEAGLLKHRAAIREALLPSFRALHAEAIEAQRQADAIAAKRVAVLSALNALDHFARPGRGHLPG
ncbi:hypothetical protein [Nocardioides sp. Leaf374]|uniref:hypothetical protein n=1 Tax=Nocardioides sp. Leaf374 TaxID=2876560 RepID=UPI001E4AABC7|nr:hypothetical protein [Nocardioides sp. Leaf374]